jgi:hypothetical protein
MALNQPSGPPASHRQLEHLRQLIAAEGHEGFRDARGPLGLTQRQAAGKFTRDEADELIARLEGDDHDPTASLPTSRVSPGERAIRDAPDAVLAGELQRRGWIVMEP